MNEKITQSDSLELEQIVIGLEFRKTYYRYDWYSYAPLNPFEPGDKVLISMTKETERATIACVQQLFKDGYVFILRPEETEKMVMEATEDLVRRLKGEEDNDAKKA